MGGTGRLLRRMAGGTARLLRWVWRGGALHRIAVLLLVAFFLSKAGPLSFVWGVAQSLVAAAMVFIVEFGRSKGEARRLRHARDAMRTVVDKNLAPMDQTLIRTIAKKGQLPLDQMSKMLADEVQAREKLLHALGALEGEMPESEEDIDLVTRRQS